ncbi:hypothetical protein EGM70_14310 [Enterobacteriaceae bacterium 89]|nr:hypothetical protein [Enterobacteriaceae bacterium 89]
MNAVKTLNHHKLFFYANICKNIGINDSGVCAYAVSATSIKKFRINSKGIINTKNINYHSVFYHNDIIGLSAAPLTLMSGGTFNSQDINLPFGFNFIPMKHNNKLGTVVNYSTCNMHSLPVREVSSFLEEQDSPTIFSSNDSVFCSDVEPLKQLADIIKLPDINSLQIRQQIIGVYNNGKSDFIKGIPELPLDAFIDTKNYKIVSLCEAFADCQ